MAIAEEERRYGLNFAALGFTPGMGSDRHCAAVGGSRKSDEIVLAGKSYKGRELVCLTRSFRRQTFAKPPSISLGESRIAPDE